MVCVWWIFSIFSPFHDVRRGGALASAESGGRGDPLESSQHSVLGTRSLLPAEKIGVYLVVEWYPSLTKLTPIARR